MRFLYWVLPLYCISAVIGNERIEKHGLVSNPDKNINVISYELEFDLRLFHSYTVNTHSRYRGNVKITFEVMTPVDHVNVNACNLTLLRSSWAELADDKPKTAALATVNVNNDVVEVSGTFEAEKKYQLVFDFEGQIYNDNPIGLYLQQDQKHQAKLLQSQFSPKNALRAFPSFDNPYYKAPFNLRITVPRGIEVISGTKVKQIIPQGHFETVGFERTDKIATYLLGFAVGNFHKMSKTSSNGVNVTLYTPYGYPPPSAFHLESAIKCIDSLEGLLRRPFPTSDLKLVATLNQDFSWEAHGLIFLSLKTAFLSPSSDTRKLFQTVQTVCHEISHHYFGDFVGIESWKDLFLSEGLSSYYGNKALEWNTTLKTYQNSQKIKKNLKALNIMKWSEHPVISDTRNFDSVTYLVGEAMIRMLHSVLGDEIFSDAIDNYLDEYGGNVANYRGFVQSMKDTMKGHTLCDGQIIFDEFVDDFLTQTDHPVVYIDLVDDVFTFNVSAALTENQWTLPLHIWDTESDKIEMIWIKKDGTICKPNKAFSLRNTRLLVFNPEATDFVSIHLSSGVIDEYHRRMESYTLLRSMDNMIISSLATQLSLNAKIELYAACLLSIVDSLDVFKVPLRIVELVVESGLNTDFKPFMEQLYGFVDWTEPDRFDEETEIRRLVLGYAVKFDHKAAMIKCNDIFQHIKENCRDPSTFKECHHLAASIRIPVYSAALISDPHAREYLEQHLNSLNQDDVSSAKEWAEIEELLGILDQFDHSTSASPSEVKKKCYPIDDNMGALMRLRTF